MRYNTLGLSPTNLKTDIDSTLRESPPALTTIKSIKYWISKFKQARTSCQDHG